MTLIIASLSRPSLALFFVPSGKLLQFWSNSYIFYRWPFVRRFWFDDRELRLNIRSQYGKLDYCIDLADFESFFSQDYTITMYLNQYWKDERLAFSSEENKVLTLSGDFAEKIWVPDTFFANDKKR